MKLFTDIIQFILIICLLIPQFVCGVEIDNNQDTTQSGECGEEVFYTVIAINNEPVIVDIKAEIGFSEWYSKINKNEYINVLPDEQVKFQITIKIPFNPLNDSTETSIDVYQRISMGGVNDYIAMRIVTLNTTTEKQVTQEETKPFSNDLTNLMFTAGILAFFGALIFYTAYHKLFSKGGFPRLQKILTLLSGYTRLNERKLLGNPYRQNILRTIKHNKHGMTFTDLCNEMEISHPSFLNYHLRRLMEFGYVRSVDNLYFPRGAPLKKPFINEIHEAMDNGANTPTEIARMIDSYPQKVRYHMRKHGILKSEGE